VINVVEKQPFGCLETKFNELLEEKTNTTKWKNSSVTDVVLTKELSDWTIEGPRAFEKDSVINQNKYNHKLEKVVINTEEKILLGREEDRKKISMAEIPLDTNNKKS